MSPHALPEGLTEEDYESIESAVMETVRGRWFLSEFGRRSRAGELRQMLDAIARLEHVVVSTRALPAGEVAPHARLLAQRAGDIAGQMHDMAQAMREIGLDESLCAGLDTYARAVAGLPRPTTEEVATLPPPRAALPAPLSPAAEPPTGVDRRLAALGALDSLSTAEKIILFT